MDVYQNFDSLAASETEGVDFEIQFRDISGSQTLIVAPHGGKIEPGTTELADAIASDSMSFYSFVGIKPRGNSQLHITSHRFDEPHALELVQKAESVLALHGERSKNKHVVYIGGRNKRGREILTEALQSRGYRAEVHRRCSLQGLDPMNICNRGLTNEGVQLELSYGFRRSMFHSLSETGRQTKTEDFWRFVYAVRYGLDRWVS